MNKQKKALADLAVNTLSNISVIGAGLALYEQKWWCLLIALVAIAIATYTAWRSNK